MSRLLRELSRLYAPVAQPAPLWGLVSATGLTRALVLELARPADWSTLGEVWRGVQSDLGWPAPAIAVSGVDAFQLWFSLAEPVSAALGQDVLGGLCSRYLPQVRADRLTAWPRPLATHDEGASEQLGLTSTPRQHAEGQWSAFVAPDLAPVFEDTPWLDTPPNLEGQADLLAHLTSIRADEFKAACQALGIRQEGTPQVTELGLAMATPARHHPAPQVTQQDPRQFLLQVMNDDTVPLPLRIEAAKALLPFGLNASS